MFSKLNTLWKDVFISGVLGWFNIWKPITIIHYPQKVKGENMIQSTEMNLLKCNTQFLANEE